MADTCSRYDISRNRTAGGTLLRDESTLSVVLDPVLLWSSRDNSMRSWFTPRVLPGEGTRGDLGVSVFGNLKYFVGVWRITIRWNLLIEDVYNFEQVLWDILDFRRLLLYEMCRYSTSRRTFSEWISRALFCRVIPKDLSSLSLLQKKKIYKRNLSLYIVKLILRKSINIHLEICEVRVTRDRIIRQFASQLIDAKFRNLLSCSRVTLLVMCTSHRANINISYSICGSHLWENSKSKRIARNI